MTRLRTVGSAAIVALGMLGLASGCSASGGEYAGTWGAADGPNLTLESDGTLDGTDGCNLMFGDWSVRGDVIEFTDVMITEMYCENIDTWLSGLATATVDGDVMHVANSDGTEIGTLTRDGGQDVQSR